MLSGSFNRKRGITIMSLFRMSFVVSLFIFHALPVIGHAQLDSLKSKIEHIVGGAKGKIGVAVQGLENADTITINGSGKFPMQSVYKFPLAVAVLHLVDQGKLSLDQKIFLSKEDLRPVTWSPIKVKYPNGNVDVTLDELLMHTVSESDNICCDILFRLAGGPNAVNRYIHNLGIDDIAITATEEEMAKEKQVQYQNSSTPAAMAQLLSALYHDKILSVKSKEYLLKLMEQTVTGPGRLKALLPKGTIVAHKTGSSGTDAVGMAPATNDVGIITLPGGRHYIVVVFVSDSFDDEKTRDNVIAQIAKLVWDEFADQ